MTHSVILIADMLDIIFEHRNKDYGAYALRRGYNLRLLTAIGAAFAFILLFIFIEISGKKNVTATPLGKNDRTMKFTEVKLQIDKIKKEEKIKETNKSVKNVTSKKYVSTIEIKQDDQVKETLPEVSSLAGKEISDQSKEGIKDQGISRDKDKHEETGAGNTTVVSNEKTQPDFIANEKDPEFPGGSEALKRFLAKNLSTPSDLEIGEKNTVYIRFKVDIDGTVNTFEIITSGGKDFDNEVIRVCKKMPRWKPAIQNGINVSVRYVLPVTFIGVEQ
ncbi:MAG: energy transducer TonB [Chitinophagaceae bacterium]